MSGDEPKKPGDIIADLVDTAAPQPPVEGFPAMAFDDGLPPDETGDIEPPPAGPDPDALHGVDPDTVALCAAEPQNDTGNGRRLLLHFGEDMLHVREIGWHCWTGHYWQREGGDEAAVRAAQRTAARIALEADMMAATLAERMAIEAGEQARLDRVELDKKPAGDLTAADRKQLAQLARVVAAGDEAGDALKKRRLARRRFAVSSGNASRVIGMIAQALPHRTVPPEALDADPLAVNVDNGTLHFTIARAPDPECPDPGATREIVTCAVELRPHERGDCITKLAPVAYDPEATCPRFDAFLARFQPVEALRDFLQTYHGYALTGLSGEQCLVFNHGLGANGKSTFIEIICRVMGNYAQTLPFESLAGDGGRRGDQATPDIARLPGARLVRASEPERGVYFKESLLKSLTGGEPMLARHLHKGFFEFRPVFKLVLSGNQKPEIGGVDHGIWRRMRLVPWSVTIPDAERRALDEVLAEFWAERSGILNWLIDGARRYLTQGLIVPEEVLAATASYREDMDPLGAFIRACVETVAADANGQPQSSVTAREMYEAFVAWCEANSVRPWKEKSFGLTLPQKGIVKTDERIRRYLHVRLHDVPPRERRHSDGHGEAPRAAEDMEIPI